MRATLVAIVTGVKELEILMNGLPSGYGRSSISRTTVAFPLENSSDAVVENMHVLHVSGDTYIVDNSPFYVYGISFGDKIVASKSHGKLLFSRILERGGHSTYRIKLPSGRNHAYFLRYWPALAQLGCSYEGSSANPRRLYAIDLPPEVDVAAVYAILEGHEQAGIWEFEEAHYCDGRH